MSKYTLYFWQILYIVYLLIFKIKILFFTLPRPIWIVLCFKYYNKITKIYLNQKLYSKTCWNLILLLRKSDLASISALTLWCFLTVSFNSYSFWKASSILFCNFFLISISETSIILLFIFLTWLLSVLVVTSLLCRYILKSISLMLEF